MTEKAAKQQSKNMEKEYEKKFAEAQAKGDYQELARLAQEMQKKAGEANLKAVETKKNQSVLMSISTTVPERRSILMRWSSRSPELSLSDPLTAERLRRSA